MRKLTRNAIISAVSVATLSVVAPVPASSMPVARAPAVTAGQGATEVAYRRHYARRGGGGAGAAAALGVFGAIAGAAIASQAYNNDYYYDGYPGNYGYGSPAWGYDEPVYGGPRYYAPRYHSPRAWPRNHQRGNWHDGGS